jgi:hypothetical protein
MIEDGRNGRLMPAEASVEQFAEAVVHLIRDEEQQEASAREARRTAKSVSRDTCARQVIDLYEAVCRQERRIRKDYGGLDDLVRRLRSEWELASGKVSALKKAVDEEWM